MSAATAETHDGTTTATEPALGHYEGQPIVAAGLTINNASGGLHDAVAVDPVRLDVGSTVHVVLECVVRPPQFDPVDKDNLRGPLKLVNRLHADSATFIDAEVVKERLDEQRERIAQAKAIEDQRKREEAGEVPLPFGEDGEPETVGDVLNEGLDGVLSIVEDAEDDVAWREERRAQLETWSKELLTEELTDEYDVTPPSKATHGELVELVLDEEAKNRG